MNRFLKILIILLVLIIGLYYYPAPQRDFFKLYTQEDVPAQSLQEFQSRETSEIEIDQVKWMYYAGGRGDKTILFLHGMGGSYDIWWQQILKFEADYRIISYTLPKEIKSLEKCSQGIQAILEKEKVTSFTVVGSSMGGYIAQYLVNTIPEKIDKAVFGNTFPPNSLIKKENRQKEKIIPWLPEIVLVKLGDKKLKEKLIPAGKNSKLLEAFLPSIQFNKEQFMNRYAVVIDVFAPKTSGYNYKRIPKLILESDNDPLVQKELRTALKELYSDAQAYTFHNAGHFPYINEAKEYNTILKQFLEQENEYELIEESIQNYFKGRQLAAIDLLRSSFDKTAFLWTNQENQISSFSLDTYLSKVKNDGIQTVNTQIIDGTFQDKIASFKTQFTYPNKTYIDFLNLIKKDNMWKITSKTYIALEN